MKYAKKDAKAHARDHMKGIWAATLTPFTPTGAVDEDGFRENIRHWLDELKIDGLFVCGKQGEFFSMSVEERKRNFELAVEAAAGRGTDDHVVLGPEHGRGDRSCTPCRRRCGADYIVVHAPLLHFLKAAGRDAGQLLPRRSPKPSISASRSGAIRTAAI